MGDKAARGKPSRSGSRGMCMLHIDLRPEYLTGTDPYNSSNH